MQWNTEKVGVVDGPLLEEAILSLADSVYLTATLLLRYVDETAPIYEMIAIRLPQH